MLTLFTLTDAQIRAWLISLMWPFFRILGLFVADPFYGSRIIPARVKVAFAFVLAVLVSTTLPPLPLIDPFTPLGVLITAEQLLIGVAIGFVMRLMFASVEMAGHLIGLQMGLGFASFYDPAQNASSILITQFYGLLVLLLFLSLDGHLVVLDGLAKSFVWLPVSTTPLKLAGLEALAKQGGDIFVLGVLFALPVLTALLATNLAIGVMTRAAPQLNIFAIGFPITLGIGVLLLFWSLPGLIPLVERMIRNAAWLIEKLAQGF